MSGKFCISLTCGKDNTDKATVAFVVANAAVASDKDTVVFLNIEGCTCPRKGTLIRFMRRDSRHSGS